MRVAFAQLEPRFGDVRGNVEKAIAAVTKYQADLFILPELYTTGYVFLSRDEALSLAESANDGFALRTFSEFARDNDTAVIFGFAEKDGDRVFNSCAFIDGQVAPLIYRKIHLFYDEKRIFEPGNRLLETFDYRGARLGMMICFDWIFPEVSRSLALMGAELICHPANLVMPYCQQAMITRSLENRVFSATANRIGAENRGGQTCQFTGQSQIVDIFGNVIYRASADKEEIFVADINVAEARSKNVNEANNLWSDRRVDFYRRLEEK